MGHAMQTVLYSYWLSPCVRHVALLSWHCCVDLPVLMRVEVSHMMRSCRLMLKAPLVRAE